MKGIALCLVFGFFALQSQPLLAQTNNKKAVEEELSGIRGEKQRLSQQLSKDQEVIQKYQKLIYTTKQKYQQEKKTLEKIQKDQQVTQQQLGALQSKQKQLEATLRSHEDLLAENQLEMVMHVIGHNQQPSNFQFLSYRLFLSSSQNALSEKHVETKSTLDVTGKELANTANKQNELVQRANTHASTVKELAQTERVISTQSKELEQSAAQKRAALKKLQARERKLNSLLKSIERAIAKKKARELREAKARAAKEAQNKNATARAPSKEVVNANIRLSWPLRGQLVRRFDELHQQVRWRGIFIGARKGTEIRAAAAGEVVYAEPLAGFEEVVILDHGNDQLTVYANCQELLVKSGEKVSANQVLGKVTAGDNFAESGLYFELRANGKPVDPLRYIK